MTNISFGSTYIVSNRHNTYDAFSKFQEYALTKECENVDSVQARLKDSMDSRYPYEYTAQYTLIAPDEMDSSIERFCSYNGIEFSRLSNEALLDPAAIVKRISLPEKGQIRTRINAEKLEELIQNQSTNFDHCKRDYENYYKENVDFMLKSGERFPTTTLHINSTLGANNDALLNYIERYGAQKLNPEQIRIDFCQHTDEPDHCVYFALRDLGMKNVPVYVDSDTFQVGSALGLFK